MSAMLNYLFYCFLGHALLREYPENKGGVGPLCPKLRKAPWDIYCRDAHVIGTNLLLGYTHSCFRVQCITLHYSTVMCAACNYSLLY